MIKQTLQLGGAAHESPCMLIKWRNISKNLFSGKVASTISFEKDEESPDWATAHAKQISQLMRCLSYMMNR